jgi:hypothetical protein
MATACEVGGRSSFEKAWAQPKLGCFQDRICPGSETSILPVGRRELIFGIVLYKFPKEVPRNRNRNSTFNLTSGIK